MALIKYNLFVKDNNTLLIKNFNILNFNVLLFCTLYFYIKNSRSYGFCGMSLCVNMCVSESICLYCNFSLALCLLFVLILVCFLFYYDLLDACFSFY